jgi:hypothetical protein
MRVQPRVQAARDVPGPVAGPLPPDPEARELRLQKGKLGRRQGHVIVWLGVRIGVVHGIPL